MSLRRCVVLAGLALSIVSFPRVDAYNVVPYIPQSFFFTQTPSTQSPPIPVTAQCDVLPIIWQRASQPVKAPNPVPPYFLRVYASSSVQPFIIPAGSDLSFDWAVPFAPGTQYQICMVDSNGASGGCQGTFTVVASPVGNTSCKNVTAGGLLDVDGQVVDGPIARYGWIDQCSDISVLPKNGTPPYTLTIAPALHPPYNITSSDGDAPINWTVSLNWASPFFLSVSDSAGNTWSQGPLHSANNGNASTACLDTDTVLASKPSSSSGNSGNTTAIAAGVGGGIGGLLLGLLIGLVATYCFIKHRKPYRHEPDLRDLGELFKNAPASTPAATVLDPRPQSLVTIPEQPYRLSPPPSNADSSSIYRPMSSAMPTPGTEYPNSVVYRPVSPVALGKQFDRSGNPLREEESYQPDYSGRSISDRTSVAPDHSVIQSSTSAADEDPSPPSPGASSSRGVYVLHHDAGKAPVTVYTARGDKVVELPPRYRDGNLSQDNDEEDGAPISPVRRPLPSPQGEDMVSMLPTFLAQQRRPNAPTKMSRQS